MRKIALASEGLDFGIFLEAIGFIGVYEPERLVWGVPYVDRDPSSGDSRLNTHLMEAAFHFA